MIKKFFIKNFPWTTKHLGNKSEKGIALLMAVFTVVLISYIVVEVSYDSAVEYNVNAQAINRLKAYYAARSGLELSLLRIKIYSKLQSQLAGMNLPAQQKSMADLVWKFPFAWPPQLPDELNAVDKELITGKVGDSLMDANYLTVISEEGSKIDINYLNSSSQTLRNITKKQLQEIYDAKIKNDEQWARLHQSFDLEKLLNSITDWETKDKTSLNGGAKSQYYTNLGTDEFAQKLPPNRGFRTLNELHMVAGMTDDIFNLYADSITVYGMGAVNPNFAPPEVLMSLDPTITKDVVAEIQKRLNDTKNGGPFEKADDFWSFVNTMGARVSADTIQRTPLTFDAAYNFRIKSTGTFGNATREINAIVYDVNYAAKSIAAQAKKDNQQNQQQGSPPPNPQTQQNQPAGGANLLPKGPPRIVYWNEK